MVRLSDITEQDLYQCLKLKVQPSQQNFVASNAFSLAEAWMYGDAARPFAIYDDAEMVGFLMLSVQPEKPEYGIWRLMIDEKYQGKGYGRKALRLGVERLKTLGAKRIVLSYAPENNVAAALYKNEGFALTGEVDDGEVVAVYTV